MGGNLGVNSVKLMYFLKNLLYSSAVSIQTMCIIMMTKQRSTKIENFKPLGQGLLCRGMAI